MNKRIGLGMLMLMAFMVLACSKSSTLNDMVTTGGTTVATGTFSGTSRYNTSGMVRIVDSGTVRKLVFQNFRTDPGPNLDVYLATDRDAGTFINLGDLKATNGQFEYTLDKATDLSRFRYVLIWCVSFTVLFGSAEMQ